jgi:class 3 adenylate cyclase
MPVYIDVHDLPPGTTPEDVAKAHSHDLEVQGKYGVNYSKYWHNESAGKVFCLCHAPNEEAAVQVHKEAHGLMAEKLIEVEPEMADLFLGSGELNNAGAVLLADAGADDRDPGIRTILFTDIVDSTSLTQRMGDEGAMMLLRMHDSIVREALKETGGREIKHTGDGIMASFVSAAGAVKCATRIQSELSKPGGDNEDGTLKLRIGLAAGEPVEHHDDLFGATVQLAARLCTLAQPDQIIAASVVHDLCLGKKLPFKSHGAHELKGFDRAVTVYEVDWREGRES